MCVCGGGDKGCLVPVLLLFFLAVMQVMDKAKVMLTYCALSFLLSLSLPLFHDHMLGGHSGTVQLPDLITTI